MKLKVKVGLFPCSTLEKGRALAGAFAKNSKVAMLGICLAGALNACVNVAPQFLV